MVQRSVESPASSRTVLWWRAWELVAAHPFLGVGPLHFAHDSAALNLPAHPHNWVMQIGAEWGLPALLVDGLLSGLIVMPVSQLLIVLYGAGYRRWLAAAVVLASMAALLYGAWPGLPVALRLEAEPSTPPTGNIYNPRLWRDGMF